MKTKNSLSLFEEAVASYQLSQVLSRPDKELLHRAFYFALHRFMSGEDFSLERLYAVSPKLLFEQFYCYYQRHSCYEAFVARVLPEETPAAKVMKAVVYCLETETGCHKTACCEMLQKTADFEYLKFLGSLSSGYPQVLALMSELLEKQKSAEAVYLQDLLAAYRSRKIKWTKEYAVVYQWMALLNNPSEIAKNLVAVAKWIEADSDFMEFHVLHLTALLEKVAKEDVKNVILPETVLFLSALPNIAIKFRLEILSKYFIRIFPLLSQDNNRYETVLSALWHESYLQCDEECYSILSQLQQVQKGGDELSLTLFQWAEQSWRGYYLANSPDDRDFYEDTLWRFTEEALQGNGDRRSYEWLELCCDMALKMTNNVWCYEPLPMWLALQIYRHQKSTYVIENNLLQVAKNILWSQCNELERFLEERENQIEWKHWKPVLDYFWSAETSEAISKILQVVAYYVYEDKTAIKTWAESHGMQLTGWGRCVEVNEKREALMAALKVD